MAAPRAIPAHPRALACGDPPASARTVTPSMIARNPPTTATCSQVISRTLPSPSQNSWSASPLASVSAAAFLALPSGSFSTRYGGRTAS